MEIIALALKEGAGFARPTFNLYEKILKDWYDRELRTAQDVKAHLANRNKKTGGTGQTGNPEASQKGNHSQRQYSQDFFDSLYKESDSQ